MLDASSKKLIDELHPEVAERAKILLLILESYGIPARLTSARRSSLEQWRLYLRGRATPGPIVTNAKPGSSYHELGRAFDIAFLYVGTNAPRRWWQFAGRVGKSLGLRWGGNFRTLRDRPHFER